MWQILVPLAAVAVTAGVTWLVAHRENSGRIDVSPATELWASMRSELARVQTRLTEVETRLAKAEANLAVSRSEVIALQGEAANLRRTVDDLEHDLALARKDS